MPNSGKRFGMPHGVWPVDSTRHPQFCWVLLVFLHRHPRPHSWWRTHAHIAESIVRCHSIWLNCASLLKRRWPSARSSPYHLSGYPCRYLSLSGTGVNLENWIWSYYMTQTLIHRFSYKALTKLDAFEQCTSWQGGLKVLRLYRMRRAIEDWICTDCPV